MANSRPVEIGVERVPTLRTFRLWTPSRRSSLHSLGTVDFSGIKIKLIASKPKSTFLQKGDGPRRPLYIGIMPLSSGQWLLYASRIFGE